MADDDKRLFEDLPYQFTPDELRALGDELAARNREAIDLETQRKAALAAFTATARDLNREIASLTNKIMAKSESRETEILILLDTPKPGWKTIIRAADNHEVRSEAMTAREMQTSFGFQDRPDDRPEAK